VVQTEYDSAGRVAGVRNQGATSYYAGAAASDATNRIQYAPQGAVSIMKLGNGKWEHTNFNNRLQPTQIGLGTSGTDSSILKLDYGYGTTSNNGNVLSQTMTITAPSLTLTQCYGYDYLNTAGQGYVADNVRQKFTQKERDGESGLDYFLARYYSSVQGRFTSVDPINLTEERLLDPQQINLYVYTRNDPLNLLDPTGATIDFDKDKNGNLTKNGKYSQDLYKKYVEFLNKDSKKYASQLQTIARLEKSEVNYLVNVTTSELSGSHEAEGRTSTDGANVLVTIRNIGGPQGGKFSIEGRFAHELEHARQFDEGEFSFVKAANGEWIPDRSSYDIYDEVRAFKAQLDVSPPTADTQLLRQLRDSRISDDQRAKILVSGGYPNRNPVSSNVTHLWNAPPGTLVRPTAAHPNAFGRVHN
jgi:RHS repeat-associated protein